MQNHLPKLLGYPKLLLALVALLLVPSSGKAEVTFQWLGIAGFTLSDGATTLVFDPAITRPGLLSIGFNRKIESDEAEVKKRFEAWKITKVDGVFLSHEHFDHSIDAGTVLKNYGGKLYGDVSTVNLGKSWGIPADRVVSMPVGTSTTVGKFKVTSMKSPHGAIALGVFFAPGEISSPIDPAKAKAWDYRVGESISFLIEHPEGKIYFQQTGSIPTPDPADGMKADVLFLGIANRPSTKDLIERRILKLGAKRVIPLHFDDFFKPIQEPEPKQLFGVKSEEFLTSAKAAVPGAKIELPKYGVKEKLF